MKRILFAGSADFSLPTLRALHEAGVLCGVLSAPDSPAGRSLALRKNPVAQYAHDARLPLLQPEALRSEAREAASALQPDALVCAAYGKIFGPKFLSLFPSGAVNVHPSLLPRFRGAAPVPAVILAGDAETGVTLQTMALEMDCGRIILQTRTPIGPREGAGDLLARLAADGANETIRLMRDFDALYARAAEQDHAQATYCTKIHSAHGYIASFDDAPRAQRIARAFAPAAVKMRYTEAGVVIKMRGIEVVDEASCGARVGTVLGFGKGGALLVQAARGIFSVSELQLPGRKMLPAADFARGEPGILAARLW